MSRLLVLPLLIFMQTCGRPMDPSFNSVPIIRSNLHGLVAIRVGPVDGGTALSGPAPAGCAGELTHRDENI